MTYVLNLSPDVVERIEAKARKSGVPPLQWIETIVESASFEGADDKFEEVMNQVFNDYQKAFEVLAEGPK